MRNILRKKTNEIKRHFIGGSEAGAPSCNCFLSFSCSFLGKICAEIIWSYPPPLQSAPNPPVNPGSATVFIRSPILIDRTLPHSICQCNFGYAFTNSGSTIAIFYENPMKTIKSSCMNARGIPTAVYQVLGGDTLGNPPRAKVGTPPPINRQTPVKT